MVPADLADLRRFLQINNKIRPYQHNLRENCLRFIYKNCYF